MKAPSASVFDQRSHSDQPVTPEIKFQAEKRAEQLTCCSWKPGLKAEPRVSEKMDERWSFRRKLYSAVVSDSV